MVRDFANPRFEIEQAKSVPPGPGEVTVAVHSVPIGFADGLIARGQYQIRPDLPFTPGIYCSGIVTQTGSDVVELKSGDWVIGGGWIGSARNDRRLTGTLADAVTAPATNFQPLAPGTDLQQAALFCSHYETAHHALTKAGLRADETLLVLGAGGGTGVAAIVLARRIGARVIASASTPEKRDVAAHAGANHVIDSRSEDWRTEVAALTGGRGVDMIFDPVGGDATERAFRAIAPGGRHLVIGFASGSISRLPLNLAILKNASIVGVDIVQFRTQAPDAARAQSRQLIDLLGRGMLTLPPIARC